MENLIIHNNIRKPFNCLDFIKLAVEDVELNKGFTKIDLAKKMNFSYKSGSFKAKVKDLIELNLIYKIKEGFYGFTDKAKKYKSQPKVKFQEAESFTSIKGLNKQNQIKEVNVSIESVRTKNTRLGVPYRSLIDISNAVENLYVNFKEERFTEEQMAIALNTKTTSSTLNEYLNSLRRFGFINGTSGIRLSKEAIQFATSKSPEERGNILLGSFNRIGSYQLFKVEGENIKNGKELIKKLSKNYGYSDEPARKITKAFLDSVALLNQYGKIQPEPKQVKLEKSSEKNVNLSERQESEAKSVSNGYYISYPIGSVNAEFSLPKRLVEMTKQEKEYTREMLELILRQLNGV